MFKKLGKKKEDFYRSYDDKRGQKSQKIIKQIDVNQKKNSTFFVLIISFLNESTKNKMYQKQKLLPYCEPEKT